MQRHRLADQAGPCDKASATRRARRAAISSSICASWRWSCVMRPLASTDAPTAHGRSGTSRSFRHPCAHRQGMEWGGVSPHRPLSRTIAPGGSAPERQRPTADQCTALGQRQRCTERRAARPPAQRRLRIVRCNTVASRHPMRACAAGRRQRQASRRARNAAHCPSARRQRHARALGRLPRLGLSSRPTACPGRPMSAGQPGPATGQTTSYRLAMRQAEPAPPPLLSSQAAARRCATRPSPDPALHG